LDPHKPVIPPAIPKDKSAVDDVALLTLGAIMEESGEKEFLPEKVEDESQVSAGEGEIDCSTSSMWKRSELTSRMMNVKDVSINFVPLFFIIALPIHIRDS